MIDLSVGTLAVLALGFVGAVAVLGVVGVLLRGRLKGLFEARYEEVSGSAAEYRVRRDTAFPVHLGRTVSKWVAILGFASIALSERVAGIAIDTARGDSST